MRLARAARPRTARRPGINRYLYGVYAERDDLRRVYPDLDGSDGEGFARLGMGLRRARDGHPGAVPAAATRRASRARLRAGQAARAPQAGRCPAVRRPDLSMNVTGLLTGTLGLGEAARGYVRGARRPRTSRSRPRRSTCGEFVQLGDVPHEGYARVDYADRDGAASAGFNLVCINADELPRFARVGRRGVLLERPAIGVWGWETDHVPERWREAFGLLDEIWVYSELRRREPRHAPRRSRCGAFRRPCRAPDPGDVDARPGHPERLPVPVHVRLLQHDPAQEPGRPDRGVPAARSSPARGRSW